MALKWKDGHLAWADGHIVFDCNCCGTPCSNCSDTTPTTLTITFTGTSVSAGCTDCVGGVGFSSMKSTGASDWDGTYTLTQEAGNPCCWRCTFTGPVVEIYHTTSGCAGDPACILTDWYILLCKGDSDPAWGVFVASTDTSVCSEAALYEGLPDALGDTTCSDAMQLPTFTGNNFNGDCENSGEFFPGSGGNAVVTP